MRRLLAILLLACTISRVDAHNVHVDFDHARDFSRYQTYEWAPSPKVDFLNQLMQSRLIGFIDEALAVKRLRRVETGGDLLVTFQMNVRQENIYTTLTNGFGWDWGWGSEIATTTEQVITLGTLTVDVVDSHGSRLVFEGLSTAPISSKPAHNTKRLAKAVSEIFEKYPPR